MTFSTRSTRRPHRPLRSPPPVNLRYQGMSENRSHHEQVKAHYGLLAANYGSRANRTCQDTYLRLLKHHLAHRERVLEVGTGSNGLIGQLGSRFAVGCDLSVDM